MPIYFAPWNWVTAQQVPLITSHWEMPRADIGLGAIDLRSLPQCGSPGPTPQGFGLFSLSSPALIGLHLGDTLFDAVSLPLRRATGDFLNIGSDALSSQATNVLSLIMELYNRLGDPTGGARWKPIRGALRSGVALTLGRDVMRFPLSALMRDNTIAVFQADYRRNKADGVPLTTLRKWTGSTMRSLWNVMDDEHAALLLPPEFVGDGWQPPATVITESFNTADSDTLGPDLTWTEVSGNHFEIITNKAENKNVFPAVSQSARAGTALASADHYAQADVTWEDTSSAFGGTATRFAAAAETYYRGGATGWDNTDRLAKVVTAVLTELFNQAHTINAETLNVKHTSDGSTIKVTVGLAAELSGTDTSITGNLRTGIACDNDSNAARNFKWDVFEGADLAAAATAKGLIPLLKAGR